MNKRRLFTLSVSLICIITVFVGALYWYSEQRAEQKLQFYIGKLENRYILDEHSMSDFDIDDVEKATYWNDFTLDAEWEGVDHIYFDRKIHNLYFLKTDENGVTAHLFNYKKIM